MPPSSERLSVLGELLAARRVGFSDPLIVDVTHDSRQAGAGSLFVAVRGSAFDGHDFVESAIGAGAAAVVVEHDVEVDIPYLVVADARAVLAPLAAAVHGHPSHEVAVVGVTGTNGKTSVTYLIESIAKAAGRRVGVIGTIQTRIGGDPIPTLRTTPEASDFQRLLRLMADRGAEIVATEVSSHALALGRVEATRFAVAAFTNLSQDHLDFHGDMEAYYQAKRSLFDAAGRGVIWTDDPWGRRLHSEIDLEVITVGLGGSEDLSGEVLAIELTHSIAEIRFPDGTIRAVRVPLAGRFNVANAMVAAGCGVALGLEPDRIVEGIESCPQVPGRFEVVSDDDPVTVIVDYAHTPAGIEGAVEAARALSRGKVIALIGAGGDRDRSKRPAMGAAGAAADQLVVTSDNPRSEDPDAIINEIMQGIPQGASVECVTDRRSAISSALAAAGPGDIVLILGKGHERGQEVAGKVLAFDDRAAARAELARLRGLSR